MNVSVVGRYALGVAALVVVFVSLAWAAVALRRHYWPDLDGALACLAEIVIGLALLTWISELLGTVGGFRLGWVVAGCVVVALVVRRAMAGNGRADNRAARVSATGPARRHAVIAIIATTVVVADWAASTVQSYRVGILTFDSLWYHLPWAATFAQSGHVTPLHFTDVEYLTAFYPATAELFHGLGIVLLGHDTLSPGLNLLWLGLVLLAAHCVGRPRGAGWLTMAGAALAMALPMFSGSQAGSASNDVVGVFFLLAAVALLDAPVLAGGAAGLAIGVKLTLLAPVAALTVGVLAIARRGRGAYVAALLLAGGFWYVRNLFAVGNLLPWVGPLPTPAPPLQHRTAFTVWHYLFSSHAWSHFLEAGLRSGLGPWWPAILAVAIVGPLVCLLPPADRRLRMLALVALVSLFAYLVTPETAAGPRGDPLGFTFNLRYAAPALTLALTITPLAPILATRRARDAALAVLLLLLVATVAQAKLWPTHNLAAAIAIAVVAALIAVRPRLALLAVPVLLLGGYPLQRHYLRGRYAFKPHVSYLAPVWALFRGIHHARVGLVGTFGGFFSYPLYGVDDSNRVQYVGHRGPHGSFTPIGSCREWRAAVNAGHYRYLVTTPARDPWHPRRLGPSPEDRWTADSASTRVQFRELALGQPVTVFRLTGPLDPAICR